MQFSAQFDRQRLECLGQDRRWIISSANLRCVDGQDRRGIAAQARLGNRYGRGDADDAEEHAAEPALYLLQPLGARDLEQASSKRVVQDHQQEVEEGQGPQRERDDVWQPLAGQVP